MVYRELIYGSNKEDRDPFQEKLKESCDIFIKDTERKKYIFSCCALCFSRKKEYEIKNEWNKSNGFFCSQLVAAAYLYCGILKNNKSSKKYLPGSFSSSSNHLEFDEKFSLGPEILIDFTIN